MVFVMAELDLLDPSAPGGGANAQFRFGEEAATSLDDARAQSVLEEAARAHGSAESWEDSNLRARNWLAARLAKVAEQLPDPSAQEPVVGPKLGKRFDTADLQAFRRGDSRVVHDVRAREFILVRAREPATLGSASHRSLRGRGWGFSRPLRRT